MPRRTELILNIVSTIMLTFIGLPSLLIFIDNVGIMRGGKKVLWQRIEDEIQKAFENNENMHVNVLMQLVTSIIALVFVLTFIPVRFSETSEILSHEHCKDDCNENPFLRPATIVLHITDIISFYFYNVKFVFDFFAI